MSAMLFHTRAYKQMAATMRSHFQFGDGDIECAQFPDGERYRRIATDVAGKHVTLLGGTVSDSDTLEIYDLACAIVKYGCSRLSIVIPYFGYSTMERSVKYGEVVTAKTRARLLSSIPVAPEGNRVFMLDLHSEGIPYYFEGNVRPIHVYAKEVVKKMIREAGGENFVLACTDAGRAKWVESLANDLKVSASFIFKRRLENGNTEVAAVSADVEGRTVVIYDDMLRTGGSMVGAINAYKAAGAVDVSVVVTHGVMAEGFKRVMDVGVRSISCTDSHPSALQIPLTGSFKIHSVAKLLGEKVLSAP